MRKYLLSLLIVLPLIGSSQTATENYVKEKVYWDATTLVANPITHSSISYFDGLGRAKQVIQTGSASHVYGENNLIAWPQEWTEGVGSTASFNMYGLENENTRERKTDPFGDFSVVWKCGPGPDEQSPGYDSDGGATTDYFAIDRTQAYRYALWVKREGGTIGNTAVGCGGNSSIEELDGTPSPYAYSWVGDGPDEEWYLVVGMIHPEGYAGGYTGISGLYNTQGEKVQDGTDYRFTAGASYTRLRMYYVSGNSPTDFRYFYGPLAQAIDGTETPLEDLFKKPSETYPDIIVPMEYDQYGRQTVEYLPYTAPSQQGHIHADPFTDQLAFYDDVKYDNTPNPYSEKILESSPLGRVLEIGAPGASWTADPTSDADHTIKFEYQTNVADEVTHFEVTLNEEEVNGVITYHSQLQRSGTYPAAVLMKTVTKDENWTIGNDHTSEEFTNKSGQVVLKRAYNGEAHDTYFVYDDYGNLTYVLPPAVDTSNPVTQEVLNDWCYQYTYDNRNRMVAKKLPGKGWEHIVYNKLDQPILTQDPNQEAQGQWLFTKYDKYGRSVYTGTYNDSNDRLHHQFVANNATDLWEDYLPSPIAIGSQQVNHTNNTYPNANLELHTIAYYDTYEFEGASAQVESYGVVPTTHVKGMATGSKVRVLGTNDFLVTTLFYDEKGRVISSHQQNDYQNTTEENTNQLDFTGKTLATRLEHTKDGETTTLDRTFTYDLQNRLISTQLSINGEPAREIAANEYDDLGQLMQKNLHTTGSEAMAEMSYTYNVRGWLTGVEDQSANDYFSMELSHDQGPTPLYNGNIAHWNSQTSGNDQQSYAYTYDALNRITSGIKEGGTHSLNVITYDEMGNIQTLNRSGSNEANMDELSYDYLSGNQLGSVTDASSDPLGFNDGNTVGDDYAYDNNGNLIQDLNKEIATIEYNHLNLPTRVEFDSGEEIYYTYNAAGIKLRKEVVALDTTMITNYAGSFIYENDELQLIQHEEGRIVPKYAGQPEVLEGWDYQYHLKDHLGNVRLTFSTTPENYSITETFETGEENGWQDLHQYENEAANTTAEGNEVALLQSGETGAMILWSMNKGDTINLSVNANYEVSPGGNTFLQTAYNSLFTSFDASFGGTEGVSSSSGVFDEALSGVNMAGKNDLNPSPRAFLNYILFDKEMNYVSAGFQQISTAAAGIGVHETISINDIIAEQELYLLAYLSNENQEAVVIHFDDFTVYHGKTNVVQSNDYMPFGLIFNNYQRTASRTNAFNTFQDQERDETTGWVQFKWRNHMPEIGRFFNIDPLSEKYVYNSTYAFSENRLIDGVELEGLEWYGVNMGSIFRSSFYSRYGFASPKDLNNVSAINPALGERIANRNRVGGIQRNRVAKATAVGLAAGYVIPLDIVLLRGKISREILGQIAFQTLLTGIEQWGSGKEIDGMKAMDYAINDVDVFDAVFSLVEKKYGLGKGVTGDISRYLIQSSTDISLEDGFETALGGKISEEDFSAEMMLRAMLHPLGKGKVNSTRFSKNPLVKRFITGFKRKLRDVGDYRLSDFTLNVNNSTHIGGSSNLNELRIKQKDATEVRSKKYFEE